MTKVTKVFDKGMWQRCVTKVYDSRFYFFPGCVTDGLFFFPLGWCDRCVDFFTLQFPLLLSLKLWGSFVTHLSHTSQNLSRTLSHRIHAKIHTTFRTNCYLVGELLSIIRHTSITQVALPPHVRLEVGNLTNISN